MKKLYSFLFVVFLCFFIIECNAGNILQMKNFTLNIPDGWVVEKRSENEITLIMPKTKNEEIFISVSVHPVHSTNSLDDAWSRMRPLMIKNKNVIREDQEMFSNTKWKKLEILEIICGIEMHKIVLFSKKNMTTCLIQFNCPKDKYEKILPLFDLFKKSFAYKE